MFSIFKRKHPVANDFSGLNTDMHSHLLPGIDDGSTDPGNSIQLIKGLQDIGYSKFITTPHILWDMFRNNPTTINAAHQILKSEISNSGMTTTVHAAAEYYMDDHFDELLESNDPLLTIKDKMVLVEFSFVSTPINYKNQFFQLQIGGYQPILAHPERYLYLGGNKKVFDDLKSAGCLFQVNILSLAGYYGKPTQELAQYLLKKNYIDLLGTDLHHLRHLEALRSSPHIMPAVQSLLQSGQLLNPGL
jgi:tyrosine-protein phosphatase YwqE